MKKNLLFCTIIAGFTFNAQVTGAKTIGVDYPTLFDAFVDLNAKGVGTGGATINVPAGYIETAPAGGYVLGSTTLNGSLSNSNQLFIQKNGSGANPLFNGSAGTGSTDAIFKFSGVDYLTLDGLDLQEDPANTTATTLNERGFAFYVLNATDGCNYNTIQNSTITFLKNLNNPATAINFAHSDSSETAITPTTTDGLNSNNKLYGNTIIKSLVRAISIIGFTAPSPYTLYDQNNDIGGNSASTANTILDFSGQVAGVANYNNTAILAGNQNNSNISYNNITFATDGYGTVGINIYGNKSTLTTNNNTINAVGQTYGFASSQHFGIYCNSTGIDLTANNNTINISATLFNGAATVCGIYIPQAAASLTANNNTITGGTSPSNFYGIYSAATVALSLNNNNISGLTSTGSNSIVSGIHLVAVAASGSISNNKIYNLTANGAAGVVYGIYAAGSTAFTNTKIFNNLIGDLKTPAANSTNVNLAGLYLASAVNASTFSVYYNTINLNATSSGTTFNSAGVYHLNNNAASINSLDLRDNIIINNSTPKGAGTASALRRSAAGVSNYSPNSDYNDFYATSGVFYNGTAINTLAQLQALSRDAHSLNVNPSFVSTSGSDTTFLTLNPNDSSTQTLDDKGSVITGYTVDYSGATRSATTPDMGAYEFTYVPPTTLGTSNAIASKLSVYPNPFQDILKISDVKDVKSISVNDFSGRMVASLAPSSEVNLSKLKAGLYIVNLKMTDGSVKSYKVIKK